jgi:hypothetical protein
MLGKTRISGTIDPVRSRAALAGPGADTRTWGWQAIVRGAHVDPQAGPLADVLLLPDELPETVRLVSVYAGPGFGLYLPLPAAGDEVIVWAPSGDPDMGLVCMPRCWSSGDPAPAEIANAPGDLLLLTQKDANARVAVQGAGSLVLDVRGAPPAAHLLLGGEQNVTDAAVLGSTYRSSEASYNSSVGQALGSLSAALTALSTDLALSAATQLACANAVQAVNSAQQAEQIFESTPSLYLSRKVFVSK